MRYHQAGGVAAGGPGINPGSVDHEFSPRITVGAVNPDGLGLRVRYWDLEDTGTLAANGALTVDTYTVDFELFRTVEIACNTSLEFAAGVRYNDMTQRRINSTFDFDSGYAAWGGTFSLEGRHQLGCVTWYARGRASIVQDDYQIAGPATFVPAQPGVSVPEHTVMQTELATGFELCYGLDNGMLATARAGYEWQQWDNAVYYDNQFGQGAIDSVVDAGFNGFIIGFGIER